MNKNDNPMAGLYAKLTEYGLPKKYVRATILPSWWDDEAAREPAGFAEAAMLVARHAGVDVKSLLTAGVPVEQSAMQQAFKYKKERDTDEGDLLLARTLATQVARIAALGAPKLCDVPAKAGEVRRRILDGGADWLDLETLIEFCWSSGIPVLHVSAFPKTARKMHGLSAKLDGRPVIVLCWERKSPAWQLFVLAHELAHVALGHLEGEHVMVDEKVDRDSTDSLEVAANAFAIELLCGEPEKAFYAANRWPNTNQLARAALDVGRKHQIYPGHVVLNYAHSMGRDFWPVANAALKVLEPDADGPKLLRQRMVAWLDWSALPADSSEFLVKMTGAAVPGA